MKSRYFILAFTLIISLVSTQQLNAQSWSEVGGGTNIFGSDSIQIGVTAFCSYNGNLYVGGAFDTVGAIRANKIAIWNGTNWDSLTQGVSGFGGLSFLTSITDYKNSIYAGGIFDTAGLDSANDIACWNNSSWSELKSGVNNYVNALAVYDSGLYTGGSFNMANNTKDYYIALWNDTSWSNVGNGINPTSGGAIDALTVYNGNLIAGGNFTNTGGVNVSSIAGWNGKNWSPVGPVQSTHSTPIYILALYVYNGVLYAGGIFDSIGKVAANDIAEWNGTTWSALGNGLDGPVNAITFYNGNLYAGGDFNYSGSIAVNNIAEWNGTTWSPLGNGIIGNPPYIYSANVRCLEVYNNELYVGGLFDTAGNVAARNIAVWSEPAGINRLSINNNQLSIYPNPASTQLTITSTQPIKNIEITNLLGQLVYKNTIAGPHTNTNQVIDVSALPDGLYFVTVTTDTGTATDKFVVNK